jgi:thiosulfate dehydrogenase (quinone) large subunit
MSAFQSISRNAVSSWRNQNRAQRILRLFLGFTWVYAGWDKASDPGFLTQGASTFIGTQLAAYAQNSPIAFLLNHTIEHAVLVGIFVMVAEFAIGFATLLSIAPNSAALGGFAMSTGLWLSSSFHTKPYFLASDSAYAVMWLAFLLLLIGNKKVPSMNIQRRGILRGGFVALLAAGGSLLGRAIPQSAASTKKSSGKQIVKLAQLPVGATFNFTHSAQGVPAVLFRTKAGVFAYSAICTHQGCTVAYKKSTKRLVCPCHGAEFDPAAGAKPVAGPANSPLASLKVKVSGAWVVEA